MTTAVEQLIRSRIESTEPQNTILRTLRDDHEGKQLTERTITRLREATGDDSLRLRKQYGMTMIEWGGYGESQGRKGGSLSIAHREKSVTIDTAAIESGNAAYYAALVERNREREATLANPTAMKDLQRQIDKYLAAREAIKAALAHGGPFTADNYAIREMIGDGKTL